MFGRLLYECAGLCVGTVWSGGADGRVGVGLEGAGDAFGGEGVELEAEGVLCACEFLGLVGGRGEARHGEAEGDAVLSAGVVRGRAVHGTVFREHHACELADAEPDGRQPRFVGCVGAVGECVDFDEEREDAGHVCVCGWPRASGESASQLLDCVVEERNEQTQRGEFGDVEEEREHVCHAV